MNQADDGNDVDVAKQGARPPSKASIKNYRKVSVEAQICGASNDLITRTFAQRSLLHFGSTCNTPMLGCTCVSAGCHVRQPVTRQWRCKASSLSILLDVHAPPSMRPPAPSTWRCPYTPY